MKRFIAAVAVAAATLSVSVSAADLKSFTAGPVQLTGFKDQFKIDESGPVFSSVAYVNERVAAGDLAADLSYEVDILPRSPAIPKNDGTGSSIPANEFTAYCLHTAEGERADGVSWVPFARTAAGAPVKVYANYDLRFVAKKPGEVVFERTYEVRAARDERSSRFKQPCSDQGFIINAQYHDTFVATVQKAVADMKVTSPQSAAR